MFDRSTQIFYHVDSNGFWAKNIYTVTYFAIYFDLLGEGARGGGLGYTMWIFKLVLDHKRNRNFFHSLCECFPCCVNPSPLPLRHRHRRPPSSPPVKKKGKSNESSAFKIANKLSPFVRKPDDPESKVEDEGDWPSDALPFESVDGAQQVKNEFFASSP